MNSTCTNSAWRNIYYQSLTKKRGISSSKVRIEVKEGGEKNTYELRRAVIKEKAKHIWSCLISKRIQNGLDFEANQNSCGGQRLLYAVY